MTARTALALCLIPTALVAAPAQAEMTVDPRAVAECQAADPGFVAIEKCLPATHLGILMLDRIAKPYAFGPAGQDLASRCLGRNEGNSAKAWVCASEAIGAAQRLAAMLPSGTTLDDPLYAALSDPEAFAQVNAAEADLKATLPKGADFPFIYKPLK